jgi:hypothetical protein
MILPSRAWLARPSIYEKLREQLQRRLPPLRDFDGVDLELRSQLAQVFSPRIASIATRALNFGLYCFRVRRSRRVLLRGARKETLYLHVLTTAAVEEI